MKQEIEKKGSLWGKAAKVATVLVALPVLGGTVKTAVAVWDTPAHQQRVEAALTSIQINMQALATKDDLDKERRERQAADLDEARQRQAVQENLTELNRTNHWAVMRAIRELQSQLASNQKPESNQKTERTK